MSVCAVMLVRDEADVIDYTLAHLLTQVDHVIVSDNGSRDSTRTVVDQLVERQKQDEGGPRVTLLDDPEVGYWQSKKTTALAMRALEAGYSWVLPCDADEIWYAPDGRTLRDYLDGVPPDVQIVGAQLFNHLPTAEDPAAHEEPNPFLRVGWRQRQHAPLGKVCARLRPDLVIEAGNHSARTAGTALTAPGLVIRHFSWRSPQQYVRKIRNGQEAYAATDLPADVGAHWRMWEGRTDDDIAAHFREWFWSPAPRADGSLIYDPTPFGR